jgi:HK97 family phage major capsid protein
MPSAIEEHADTLTARIAEVRANAETIYRNAREENRDPVESEQATLDRLAAKCDDLNAQLTLATRSYDVDAAVREKLDMIRGAAAPVAYRHAGALMWDMLHAQSDTDAADRYRRGIVTPSIARAAEHLGLDKAHTVATAGGFNGLVVAPNVGPVLDPYPGDMPLFSALGATTITTATFQRPRIVDPNFKTSMSDNPQEKSESVSKAWDIVTESVKMSVVRGYINVSELLLEMVAESLSMVVGHMNARLAAMLEAKAVAAISDTTATVALGASATAAEVQAAVMQASGKVFTATQRPATWIAMGVQGWVRLGSLTNLAGDSILQVGAGDATGTGASVFGLRPVLTAGIPDADLFVGNASSIEAYERRFPVMQALEPALFGRQIGVAGGYAFYDPITTEAGPADTPPAKREGVAKIDWA